MFSFACGKKKEKDTFILFFNTAFLLIIVGRYKLRGVIVDVFFYLLVERGIVKVLILYLFFPHKLKSSPTDIKTIFFFFLNFVRTFALFCHFEIISNATNPLNFLPFEIIRSYQHTKCLSIGIINPKQYNSLLSFRII